MDIITAILSTIAFFVVLALVLGFIAFMFPIIFSLGTIFDRKINNE